MLYFTLIARLKHQLCLQHSILIPITNCAANLKFSSIEDCLRRAGTSLAKTVFSLLFKLVYPLIPHKPFLYISFSAICLQLEHIKHIKYPQLSMFSGAYKFYIGYELIKYVKFIVYNYAFVKLT